MTTTTAAVGKMIFEQAKADGVLREAEHGVRYAITAHKHRRDGCSLAVCVWRGKGMKPAARWAVPSEERAMQVVAEVVQSVAAAKKRKAEWAAEKADEAAAMREALQVGALLYYSWGYEQTNIDYFEVVRRSKTGATVWVRPICSQQVEATGPMSARVKPLPGHYKGPEQKKRVTAYGVSFGHGTGRPCSADATHNETSYH